MPSLLGDFGNFQFGTPIGTWINILGSSVGSGGQPPTTPPPISTGHIPSDQSDVIQSLSSSVVFHSTLFDGFSLTAISTYNFYTQDEQVGFSADPSASLDSIPRFVTLSWKPAPVPKQFIAARKDVRPVDQRTPAIKPALVTADAKASVSNGYVNPGVVSAMLVPPVRSARETRFDEDLFLFVDSTAGRRASDHIDDISYHVPLDEEHDPIRVNFIDPSIAGALDPQRVAVSSEHIHLASLGALAKLVGGLEVVSQFNQDVDRRNSPPQFAISADAPDLSNVGYCIERYTLGPSGTLDLSRRIDIDDLSQTSFVDREVVFGGRYAYRIRLIVQWVHASNVGFFGSSSLDRSSGLDVSAGTSLRQASFYAGGWSDWAQTTVTDDRLPDPPEELTVIPMSTKKTIRITWKVPNDPQRDISSVRLLRAEINGGRISDWTQVGEFITANGCFNDKLVDFFEESHTEYMYAMYSVSFHGERSPLTEKIAAKISKRASSIGELPVKQIGPRGDDAMAHASGIRPEPELELVAQRSFRTYIRDSRSSLPLFDRSYVIEVQSLSTGERVEVALDVDCTDVRNDSNSERTT